MTAEGMIALALRVTAVTVVCGLVTLLRRRATADERHAFWMLALVASLVMPLAMSVLPAAPVIPIGRSDAATFGSAGGPPMMPAAAPVAVVAPVSPRESAPIAVPSIRSPGWATVLAAAWLIGAIVSLVRLARAHREARRIVRRATLDPKLSLGGWPAALASDDTASPFSYGVRRPVIVLPRDATVWPPDRLRATLLHEHAHGVRRDGLALLLAQLTTAVYWWHPAIRYAARMAAAERERACDDAVLREGIRPSEYGAHLLKHAMGSDCWRGRPLAAALFSHSEGLAARIASLLDPRVDRGRLGRRRALAAASLMALVTALVAAAAPVRRESGVLPPVQRPVAAATRICEQSDPRVGRTARFDSAGVMITGAGGFVDGAGNTRLIWTGKDCIAWVGFRGTLQPTPDGRDVVPGPDARFIAHQEMGTDTVEYTMTAASGAVYTVRPRPTAAGEPDREWIAGMIREFIRRSGHDAARRAREIVDSGGVEGLLAEVRRIAPSNVRATYLLAGYPHVQDDDGRARFIRDGGSLLNGMSRARFLAGVPPAWRRGVPVLAAVYGEAAAIEDDDDVEQIVRAFPPPRPASPVLRAPLETLIATLATTERRSALRAYYLDVRP